MSCFFHLTIIAGEKLNARIREEEETTCPNCGRTLASPSSLHQHQDKYCRYREGKKAKQPAVARQRGVVEIEGDDAFRSDDCRVVRARVSVSGRVRDYEMIPSNPAVDVERWMTAEEALVKRVFDQMGEFLVRGRLVLRAWFIKRNPATSEVLRREVLHLSSLPADFIHDFHQWYISHVSGIINNLETLCKRDSDLEFDGIEALEIKFNLLDDLSGRSFFKLPDKLNRMQAVINVDVKENCFKYALLSILHYADIKKHRQRASKYEQWLGEVDFGDIKSSDVHIKRDVPKIEKLNNLKINIHVWERGQLQGCVYNNPKVLSTKTINLLLVVGSEGERHYCGIPSLSRLYYHTKNTHNMRHMCERCIRSFKTEENLEEHFQWCARGRLQIEQTPKEIKFTYNSFHKELNPLKVIYADIESYIHENTHYPAAIASYEVWHSHFTTQRQNTTTINSWSGEDCIVDFLRYLDNMAHKQHNHDTKMTRQGMILTAQQQKDFDACTHCPRCNTPFDDTKHKKVRDHCHITGKFRSALCHTCNSKLRLTRHTLPVVFHNFKCYDAHQIIKHGIGKFKHWQLNVIPQTKEKYMSLTARIPVDKTKEGKTVYFNVVFLDSFQFMSSSLANLVNNLDSLPFTEVLKRDYPNLTKDVIKRKGVFPYSYLDSLSKLQESFLPPRRAFKNDLSGEECSEEDYRFC